MAWWEYLIVGFLLGEIAGEQIQRIRRRISKDEEEET